MNCRCMIYLSLLLGNKKVLRSVDYKILSSKLNCCEILRFVSIFAEFCERNQITVIDGIASSSCSISHGVPQGSVFGTSLFLLFINVLLDSPFLFKCIPFSNASTLFTSFDEEKKSSEFTLTINHDVHNVNNWLTSNCVSINADKTLYVYVQKTNTINQ